MILAVTDTEIPTELIDLKRKFNRVEEELAALSKRMPPPTAVAAGNAAVDPADRERWDTLHARRVEVALLIRHRLEEVPESERSKVDLAATKAARSDA